MCETGNSLSPAGQKFPAEKRASGKSRRAKGDRQGQGSKDVCWMERRMKNEKDEGNEKENVGDAGSTAGGTGGQG